MSTFLYNSGIHAYTTGIRLAAVFNEKASLWIKGREGIREKIDSIARGEERLVWFHAASLGEFEQGRPVMEALKQAQPGTKILLTFFSPSGYEIRKDYKGADYILYLPADTPAAAQHFVEHFHPDAAVFVKYEFWYNYLYELHKRHIPTYLISAVFRTEQPFFKSWGGLHRQMLSFFSRLFVQNEASVELLRSIRVTNTEVTGDTRFDRVKEISASAKTIDKVAQFLQNAPAVVCGSTWPPDEDLLIDYINNRTSKYKWIITPHEIGEGHIKSIIGKCERKIVRYSDEKANLAEANVLIIDCIGLLSSIYRYGKIAYIGGGFGAGIHNTLEAAVYGIPVVFGPKYQKFNEAVRLIQEGGGFSIGNACELTELFDSLTTNDNIIKAAGCAASKYVDSQLGATQIIMKYLK